MLGFNHTGESRIVYQMFSLLTPGEGLWLGTCIRLQSYRCSGSSRVWSVPVWFHRSASHGFSSRWLMFTASGIQLKGSSTTLQTLVMLRLLRDTYLASIKTRREKYAISACSGSCHLQMGLICPSNNTKVMGITPSLVDSMVFNHLLRVSHS